MLPLAVGLVWTGRLRRRCEVVTEEALGRRVGELGGGLGLTRRPAVLLGGADQMPMTFGFWRPAVVLPVAAVGWSRERFDAVVLHELAHAYHDQVLGFGHPEVRAAWERAAEGGTYDAIARNNGRTERAYAITDHKEYFAELTESYFGTNDFFPFNNAVRGFTRNCKPHPSHTRDSSSSS